MSITAALKMQVYQGNYQITFSSQSEGLAVAIYTDRLHMKSVQRGDYALLLADESVMCEFSVGQTNTKEEILCPQIKDVWVGWLKKDPSAAFAVFKKGSSEFLGYIGLKHTNVPGESELVCLIRNTEWGKGYGTEAVTAILTEYVPAILEKGYSLDEEPLRSVVAWVRYDNPAAWRILEKAGMRCIGHKKSPIHYHYIMDLSKPKQRTIRAPSSMCIIL